MVPIPVQPELLVDAENSSDWDEDEMRRERAS
jgi:hypothetical protein